MDHHALLSRSITLSLDAMGGDNGLDVVAPAAIRALKKFPQLKLILVGDEALLKKKLNRRLPHFNDRLTIHHASQAVAMDELPSNALRYKKDSSMRVAINLVKEGKADACVSAGNTGALMATARFVLKTLSGIDRPAIFGMIPSANSKGYTRMLDLGANIDVETEHLVQFAIMASVMTQAVEKMERPRVALLNVGEEAMKGNDKVREAAKILTQIPQINYIGFAEGNDIFTGKVDVMVTDGFVGNVALKASEGLARFIRDVMYATFQKNIFTKCAGLICYPVLSMLRRRLNPAVYNGASFIGLQGTVIKSHGGTTSRGFVQAIHRAMLEVEFDVPNLIQSQVIDILKAKNK